MPVTRSPTPPPSLAGPRCCCRGPGSRRSHCKAVSAGIVSLCTLLFALVLPLWAKIKKRIRAVPANSGILEIHIHIGIFAVCSNIDDEEYNYISDLPARYDPTCSILPFLSEFPAADSELFSKSSSTFFQSLRVARVFGLLGFGLILMSVILSMFSKQILKHSLLVAALLYTISGLMLGICLVILVSAVSDQFSQSETGFVYNWSLLFALTSFLSTKIASLMSFSAYMNQLSSEEQFLHLIPGMSRKLAVVKEDIAKLNMQVEQTRVATGYKGREQFPVDLLSCSMVECTSLDEREEDFRNASSRDSDPNQSNLRHPDLESPGVLGVVNPLEFQTCIQVNNLANYTTQTRGLRSEMMGSIGEFTSFSKGWKNENELKNCNIGMVKLT